MAKNTSTPKAFEPGETNTRAVRGATAIPQTPQRDAKAGPDTTVPEKTTPPASDANQAAAGADATGTAPKTPRGKRLNAPARPRTTKKTR